MAEIKNAKLLYKSIYSSIKEPLRLIIKDKRGLFGLGVTLGFVFLATIGPLLFPIDLSVDLNKRWRSPSWEYPLGTDRYGRDMLKMVIAGAPGVLSVGATAAFVIISIGVIVGLISGLVGGKVDTALMFITDIALTIPSMVLITVLAVFIGARALDPVTLAFIMSVTAWAGLARGIRAQTLSIKERKFVEAATTLGLGKMHIILRELLPNLMNFVAINYFWSVMGAIMATVGLMFLGLIPFSQVNWGYMLNNAIASSGAGMYSWARYLLLVPVVTIILLQTGFIYLAAGLESVFNPRLRED